MRWLSLFYLNSCGVVGLLQYSASLGNGVEIHCFKWYLFN